jgi:hypothetical protein
LPIPAIPCRQITRISPPRSSSRARSSASRPTKGTRRRWGTAVAMAAVSPARAPRCNCGFRSARRSRPAARAHLLLVANVCEIAVAVSSQCPRTQPWGAGGRVPLTPSCHALREEQREADEPGAKQGELPHHNAAQRVALRTRPGRRLPETFACRAVGAHPRTEHRRPWTSNERPSARDRSPSCSRIHEKEAATRLPLVPMHLSGAGDGWPAARRATAFVREGSSRQFSGIVAAKATRLPAGSSEAGAPYAGASRLPCARRRAADRFARG